MRLPSRTMVSRISSGSDPAFVFVAALLIPFLLYLVADPDLDIFAHYDTANHQVEVQLTALLGARQAAKTKRILSYLPRIVDFDSLSITLESREDQTALHWEIAEPTDLSLAAPPVLLI